MKRSLFFFERFLLVGGRLPWNVILAVRTGGPVDERALRTALDALQADHPMLGVGIVQRGRRPHFNSGSPPIGLRIADRTGPDVWFETVQAELEYPFDRMQGPLLRVVWLRSDDAHELLLVADHCICDGRAMRLLARELLDRLGQVRPARTGHCRIDCIQDLFPNGPGSNAKRLGLLSQAGAIGWLLRGSGDVKRMWRRLRAVRPQSAAYILHWEMDAASCESLSARCRTRETTSYAALATAFLRAMRTVRPKQNRNRLLCPVDVRAQVPGIAPDALFGFPETVRLSIERGLDCDFWSQARALRRDLCSRRARLDPARTLLSAERLHGLSDWFVTLQLHGRARNDLMFSHLGDATLPQREGMPPDKVLAFLSSMPWRGTTAIFSLRDPDGLRFCLVSREETLPRRDAERIRDEAMARIAAALGSFPAVPVRPEASRPHPAL
jgi:hypothetical protein